MGDGHFNGDGQGMYHILEDEHDTKIMPYAFSYSSQPIRVHANI